ncbi:MAG: ATP-binding protein [Actinomycetota bacterium]|nr:ATP-binding protein [Actinomycetota bacterium]
MSSPAETAAEQKTLRTVVRSEWSELGTMGRSALVALGVSAIVAVVLAVSIPRQVERHLIQGEIETFTRIAQGMADEGMIPVASNDTQALAELDEMVRTRLLGSNTVRVKVWAPDGTITYSDASDVIGQTFPLSEDRIEAFQGETVSETPDLSLPENAYERTLPPVHEFYIPVYGESDTVEAVFEVYHLVEPIETTVGNVRRYTWTSIAVSFVLLAVFLSVLIIANGRALTRRQRMTDELFGDLVRSQADERSRIIGSLHDDIGQSLYRIHYGLEDMKSRVDADEALAEDLDRLGALTSQVDRALRTELRLLQYGTGEELALGPALDELAEVTEMESDLDVTVETSTDRALSPAGRVTLFRAAREAVTNVRKHAQATSVTIRVDSKGSNVRLEVVDDGIGITNEEALGILITRERLEALGGGLRVTADREGGTRFMAWLPAEVVEVTT